MKLGFERIYIEHKEFYPKDMIDRHIARYDWAASYLKKDDVVLDACCGSGYGSKILAEKCTGVVGVDISVDAIEYALTHYGSEKTNYKVKDLENVYLISKERKFDVIVSIETIEHVRNPYKVLELFYRELKSGGKLLLTTPDKKQSDGNNEYHIHEYTSDEIYSVIQDLFSVQHMAIKDKFIYIEAVKL